MAEIVNNLNQLQEILYEMLCTFDDICKKAGLPYMLYGGTCLGAVREHNIIQWDDDIDVIVWRKDMDKVQKALEANLPDYYELIKPEDNLPYFHDFVNRIVDKRFLMRNPTEYDLVFGNRNNYAWMDIFTLDGAGRTKTEETVREFLFKSVWGLSLGHRFSANYDLYKTPVLKAVVCFLSNVGKNIPMDILLKKKETFSRSLENTDFKYVCSYCTISAKSRHKYKKKEWFEDVVEMKFRDRSFPVPKGYKEYLRCVYGDYMIPVHDNKTYNQHFIINEDV